MPEEDAQKTETATHEVRISTASGASSTPENLPLADFLILLNAEIKKTILLEESEKNWWLEHAATLPRTLTAYLYLFLKEQNGIVDSYIDAAAEADPTLLSQMKQKVKQLQSQAGDLQQKESGADAEEKLQKELAQL